MKSIKKIEWFELDSPIGEPEYDWKRYHGSNKYEIERLINEDGEIIWFGLSVNWKKTKDGTWTVLSENENAKPLVKYLPEIVYGSDRIYWKECETPIYEQLFNDLK